MSFGIKDYVMLAVGAVVGAVFCVLIYTYFVIPVVKTDQFDLGRVNGQASERSAWQDALAKQRQIADKQLADKQRQIDAIEKSYLDSNAQNEADKASLQEELAKAQSNDTKPVDPVCDGIVIFPRGLSDKLNTYGGRGPRKQDGKNPAVGTPAVPAARPAPGP